MDRFFDEMFKKALNSTPEKVEQLKKQLIAGLDPREQQVIAIMEQLGDAQKQGNWKEFKRVFDGAFGSVLSPKQQQRLLQHWGLNQEMLGSRPNAK